MARRGTRDTVTIGFGPVRSIYLTLPLLSLPPLSIHPSVHPSLSPPTRSRAPLVQPNCLGPNNSPWFLTLPRPTTSSLGSPRLSSQCLFFLLSLPLLLVRSRKPGSPLFRCDADPSALADYILALLKHNGPEAELRKELATQLDEFLEKGASLVISCSLISEHFILYIECPPFIDALFTALRTKSYLPYNSPPPPPASSLPTDNGIPIPLDAIIPSGPSNPPDRSRKRQSDYADDIRPPKGPRVSQDGPFSRHGPSRGPGWSNGNWGNGAPGRAGYDEVNGAMGPRMNGRGPPTQQYHPPDQRRGICRDYYSERGPF